MKYFLYCLQHYADFDGRARRSEFWYWQLFATLCSIGLACTFKIEVQKNPSVFHRF